MQGLTPTSAPTQISPFDFVAAYHLVPGGGGRGGEAPLTEEAEESVNEKPRALVVDDAPDVTEMLAMLLRFAGYDVVTVFSAPDAFEEARSDSFDVVVSDIGMPGMNGYELAERLRGLPAYASVPLIAVTGFAMYDDRERATGAGFDAFLTKPINPTDLIELVKRLRRS